MITTPPPAPPGGTTATRKSSEAKAQAPTEAQLFRPPRDKLMRYQVREVVRHADRRHRLRPAKFPAWPALSPITSGLDRPGDNPGCRRRATGRPVTVHSSLTRQARLHRLRRERFHARDSMRTWTTLPRVARCGKTPVGQAVTLVKSGSSVGFSGVATCGSTWSCPCCAAKIAEHRRTDLHDLMLAHKARGGGFGMLTLTMRHHKGQSLALPLGCSLPGLEEGPATPLLAAERPPRPPGVRPRHRGHPRGQRLARPPSRRALSALPTI